LFIFETKIFEIEIWNFKLLRPLTSSVN